MSQSMWNKVEYLIHWAEYISREEEEKKETDHVFQLLERNGYSRSETKSCWMIWRTLWTQKPYWWLQASCMSVVSVSQFNASLRWLDIRIVNTSQNWKLQLMCHAKDRVDQSQSPGVIYRISCNDCSKVYICETGRTAKVRVDEHQALVRNGHP